MEIQGISPFSFSFGGGEVSDHLGKVAFATFDQTIAKISQALAQKPGAGSKKGKRSDKQSRNSWERACTNHKFVEHRGKSRQTLLEHQLNVVIDAAHMHVMT